MRASTAGPGSDDVPAKVAENRARMAAALGVRPDCLLTAYQVHSPDVVTIERPWDAAGASARRCDRDPGAGAGDRRQHRRLRPGPARRRDRRRHRRRACRLARRRDRHPGSDDRRHGTLRSRSRPHQGGARPDDPPAELRSRPGIRHPLQGGGRNERAFLPARVACRPCVVRPCRLYRRRARARGHQRGSRTSVTAPTPTRPASSATAARPIAASATTGATSVP